MEQIKVQTVQIQKTKEQIESLLKKLQHNGHALEAEWQRLDTMWQGSAKETFGTEMQKELQHFREQLAESEQLLQIEEQAVYEYGNCKTEISGKIAALRI